MCIAVVHTAVTVDGHLCGVALRNVQDAIVARDGIVFKVCAGLGSIGKGVLATSEAQLAAGHVDVHTLTVDKGIRSRDLACRSRQSCAIVGLGSVGRSQRHRALLHQQRAVHGLYVGVVSSHIGAAAHDLVAGHHVVGGAGVSPGARHNGGQDIAGDEDALRVGVATVSQRRTVVDLLIAVSSDHDLLGDGMDGQRAVDWRDGIVVKVCACLGSIIKGVLATSEVQLSAGHRNDNALTVDKGIRSCDLACRSRQSRAVVGLAVTGRGQDDLLGADSGRDLLSGQRVVVIVLSHNDDGIVPCIGELRHRGVRLTVIEISDGPAAGGNHLPGAVFQDHAGNAVVGIAIVGAVVGLHLNGGILVGSHRQGAGLIGNGIVAGHIRFAVLDHGVGDGVLGTVRLRLAAADGDGCNLISGGQRTGDRVGADGQRRTIVDLAAAVRGDGDGKLLDRQAAGHQGNGKLVGDDIALVVFDHQCSGIKFAVIGPHIGTGGAGIAHVNLVALGQARRLICQQGLLRAVVNHFALITGNRDLVLLCVSGGVGHVSRDRRGDGLIPAGEVVAPVRCDSGLGRCGHAVLDVSVDHIAIRIRVSQRTVGTGRIGHGVRGQDALDTGDGEIDLDRRFPGDGQRGHVIEGIVSILIEIRNDSGVQRDRIGQGVGVIGGITLYHFLRCGAAQVPGEAIFGFGHAFIIGQFSLHAFGHGVIHSQARAGNAGGDGFCDSLKGRVQFICIIGIIGVIRRGGDKGFQEFANSIRAVCLCAVSKPTGVRIGNVISLFPAQLIRHAKANRIKGRVFLQRCSRSLRSLQHILVAVAARAIDRSILCIISGLAVSQRNYILLRRINLRNLFIRHLGIRIHQTLLQIRTAVRSQPINRGNSGIVSALGRYIYPVQHSAGIGLERHNGNITACAARIAFVSVQKALGGIFSGIQACLL